MLNIQKRFVRMVAGTLSAVMITYAFVPAAAFAASHRPPPPPPRHGRHHHDRYHDKWTKHDTATVAGIAALIGLLAIANHNRRNQTPPSDPMSYAEYRDKFANGLNDSDRLVYNKLISYPAGEYKSVYTKPETLKLVQKFCKKLPYDFQFVGTRVLAMDDGSTKNYVYFNRLESAVSDDEDVTTIDIDRNSTPAVAMVAKSTPNGDAYSESSEAANDYGENREASNFAVQVLNLVNAERAKVGASPLRLNQDLQDAAAIRAEEITRNFSHTRPDGSSCFTLLRNRNRTLGENIAAGSATPEAVVDQWMHSPGHRANILNKDFKELGVGYCRKDGTEYTHYWIQMFRG